MKGQTVIISGIGFAVGLAEALVYYNLGQSAGGGFSYKIPPRKELLKTASIVLLTSVITAVLFQGIEAVLKGDQPDMKIDPYLVLLKEKNKLNEAKNWLAENKLPKTWEGSQWSYAYAKMPKA